MNKQDVELEQEFINAQLDRIVGDFQNIYNCEKGCGYPVPLPAHAENVSVSARRAIPNWPRGRSTTAAWSNTLHEWVNDEWLVWLRHSPEYQVDLAVDHLYHEQQKAMVDQWYANYRNPHFKLDLILGNLR